MREVKGGTRTPPQKLKAIYYDTPISGSYAYRVTGNAVPMGEAAGLASVVSLKRGRMPHEIAWSDVKPT